MKNKHFCKGFGIVIIVCETFGCIILLNNLFGKHANMTVSSPTVGQRHGTEWSTYTNEAKQNSGTRFMTIHHRQGQLGNQMFQLAALLGLARRTNHIPYLNTHLPDLDLVFDLPDNMYHKVDASDFEILTESGALVMNELDGHQDIVKNFTLDGYFQLFKLFNNIETKVRNAFQFKRLFIKSAREFIERNVPATHVKVGVHVRRGDAISMYQQKLGRTTPGVDYYKRAMDFYRSQHQNVTFIVVSDDKPWSRQYLTSELGGTLFSPFNHKGSDLALLTLCDHTVMSVGTFGWWGAWLAGGSIVYYGQQYRPGAELDRQFVAQDYYPPHWISM